MQTSSPEAVATLRDEIAVLHAERAGLQKQGRSEVAPRIDSLLAHYQQRDHMAREVQRAAAGMALDPFAITLHSGERIDLGPMLCSLVGHATMRRALVLTELHEIGNRAARLAEIAQALDVCERDEERLCTEFGIDRRPDARPEIVLANCANA